MNVQHSQLGTEMNGLPASTSGQFQTDEHILALNSFLGMSPTNSVAQMPTVSDQDMAFLVSAAYTSSASIDNSVYDNSPLMLNSVGVTPAQSHQITDIGADAALAVAGLTTHPSQNIESPTGDYDAVYSQQLTGFDAATLASILGAQSPAPFSANAFEFPHTSAQGFLAPHRADQFAGSVLGKRKADGMPSPMGVPMGKRVSMPASFGANMGAYGSGPMPVPSGMGMQRIASYHPGAMYTPGLGAGDPSLSLDPSMSLVANQRPISRVKTTSSITANPPTQYQRKVAHNAIERRYRNNINDRISDLRNSVPALHRIRPKKRSNDTDSDAESDEDSHVDGVEAATKLNKATILGKSTEYIYYLRRSNDLLRRESAYLQELVRKLPDGENIVRQLMRKAKADSDAATTALRMPESALQPRKKKNQA
ncbi:hypothetical protein GGH12_005099 [Coemansia sp. RSA 1822]|nr:hypothetical protein LPJ76_005043 [Coemansia sp. RSA 638]KAJ2560104.1 hypothetical protein GGH12_005099 [Coemansia sp. RSA 1822]